MLPYFREHKEDLLESIRTGRYKPNPVRRVEIPKDKGKKRLLGIPTVVDRLIQQAINQVLSPVNERFHIVHKFCKKLNHNCLSSLLMIPLDTSGNDYLFHKMEHLLFELFE